MHTVDITQSHIVVVLFMYLGKEGNNLLES